MILRKPSLARCLASHAHRAASVPETQDKPILTAAEEVTAKKRFESAQVVTWLKESNASGEQAAQRSYPPRPKKHFVEAVAAEELGRLRARVSGSNEPEPWAGSWGKKHPRPELPKKNLPPPPPSLRGQPPRPPPRNQLLYSRRVEGLLEPVEKRPLQDIVSTSAHRPIAKLAHGLDRVLFNPGVHWLRDPRSRVYNFSPSLENIPKVTDFAFDRVAGFIKSSRDEDLWELARREKRKFAGSTSSLTGMLSQIYFLISADRRVDVSTLSRNFAREPTNFTPGQRMPASVVMNYNDGVYAIDSDSERYPGADKNILAWMGTLLEKYLTMVPEEFASYMRSATPPSEAEGEPMREAYRYAMSEKIVMRSQLDCHDGRLPGTGVFDIKTRACLPIRLDLLNFKENSGYLIRTQLGPIESFEKEYYDLIRSAFLKYSFQARIGNMDGVIVAYHNTERMFGFQYIPLEEMDQRLFGSQPGAGERVFEKSISILELVADEIALCFPKQSVRCTFETEEGTGVMNIWVEPAVWEGDPNEVPVKQFEVKATSYLHEAPVRGSTAVADVSSPWTLHWSIVRLSGESADVRGALSAARGRQFRAFSVPTGVDLKDAAEFWNNLNFSGKPALDGNSESLYKPKFLSANIGIETLRAVARTGREDTKRLEETEDGKPKVVLGQAMLEVVEAVADENAATQEPEQMEHSSATVDASASQTDADVQPAMIRESESGVGVTSTPPVEVESADTLETSKQKDDTLP